MGLNLRSQQNRFTKSTQRKPKNFTKRRIKRAGLTGSETVIDAYCGIGTISLSMAKHAKKYMGSRSLKRPSRMLRKMRLLNNLDNLEFEVGNAEDWMATWQEQGIKPDAHHGRSAT